MLALSPLPSADPFVAALATYRRGRRTRRHREEVFRLFLDNPRIHKMAAKHEFDFNVKGDRDEIVQQMAIIFLEKYLDTLDQPENIYTLLYAVSRHVAQTVKGGLMSHDTRYVSLTEPDTSNHRSLRPVDHETPLAEATEVVEAAADDFTQNVEHAIDRRRAEDKLMDRLRRLDPALQARLEQAATPVERKPRAPRELSKDARELLLIRDRMRLDNRKFALALGIEHPLLCAYIYGRTKKVRKDVMAEARSMFRRRGTEREQVLSRLARSRMQLIVESWLESLGEAPDQQGFTLLGKLVGKNWHTVRRWHGNEFKPSLENLQGYERLVDRAAGKPANKIGGRTTAASAASRRAATQTGAGNARRTAARAVDRPRSKVAGNRRPAAGRTTASRPSVPLSAKQKKVRAMMSDMSTAPAAAPVPAAAPKKAAPKKVAKKAPPKAKKAPAKAKPAKKPAAKKAAKKVAKKVAKKPAAKKAVKKAPPKAAKKAAKKVAKKAPPKAKK